MVINLNWWMMITFVKYSSPIFFNVPNVEMSIYGSDHSMPSFIWVNQTLPERVDNFGSFRDQGINHCYNRLLTSIWIYQIILIFLCSCYLFFVVAICGNCVFQCWTFWVKREDRSILPCRNLGINHCCRHLIASLWI